MPQLPAHYQSAPFLFTLLPVLFYLFFGLENVTLPPERPNQVTVMGCEGSLGENLFVGGDFGSGTLNIPTDDPGIAPGYTYTRQGPPNDGLYVITNNTGAWPGLYGTWIRIRDNSPDPNGYMMVVNASFNPGIFYQQEITGLCANTTFEFSADVINLISRNTTNHIKPNISFYIDDELKFSSGDIPQDETWKTYGFTFTTGPTATNLTLSIRNNAPGGIGNDLALDNISFRPCGPEAIILPEEETFVCVDEDSLRLVGEILNSSYPENYVQWQVSADGGATFIDIPNATSTSYTITNFASGSYFYRYLVASTLENLQNFKCRVFSYPKLVTVLPKFFSITDTICSGLVYETGHSSHSQTGVYVDTLVSTFGCDSIVTLDLTVIDDPMIEAKLIAEPPSCFGIDDARITIELLRGGYPPYSYVLNGNIASPTPSFSGLGPGDYRVEVMDRFGCFYVESVAIEYPPELIVDIGPDTMVPLGSIHTFPSFTNNLNVNYQWEAPLELSCFNCPQPNVLANGNGSVILQVTDASGCMAVDSLLFSISTEDSYKIYAPNIFSPNEDGINDRFTIFSNGLEVAAIETFQIYDRWGNLIFNRAGLQPNELGQGWDGRHRGQAVEMGVYLYRVDVRFIDGMQKTFTGSVTAIR